jgi:hypothetical protein
MSKQSREREYDELLNARAAETIGEPITTADGRSGVSKDGDQTSPPVNVSVEQLLELCGFSSISEDSPITDVEAALRAVAGRLNGADTLRKEMVREAVIRRLEDLGLKRPAKTVDAVLASAAADPMGEGVEEETPPDPEELRRTGSLVLDSPDILALVDRYLSSTRFAGSTIAPKLAYLAVASRLLKRPLNLSLTGPSAAGKNFAVSSILPLFPPSGYYELEGASPLALVYSTEPFKHRTVVIGEASALHRDGIGASMIRGLIWGARLRYDTVVDGNPVKLEKEGPTGLITTTTGGLEPELTTRIWSVSIADDPRQTREVMRATAQKLSGRASDDSHQDNNVRLADAFRAAQRWLEVAGDHEVVIPYAEVLAELIPATEVRIRRDFSQLLTLIQTHALLHQQNRPRNPQGHVVATLADYEAVRAIVESVFSASVSSGITSDVRETVAAVDHLTQDPEETATITEVAKALNLTPSGAWHRVRKAMTGDWIVNQESRPHHPAKLRVGEPLPDEVPALPTPQEVAGRTNPTENRDEPGFPSNLQTVGQLQVGTADEDALGFEGLKANPVNEASPLGEPAPSSVERSSDSADQENERSQREAMQEEGEPLTVETRRDGQDGPAGLSWDATQPGTRPSRSSDGSSTGQRPPSGNQESDRGKREVFRI